jgi:hypothetical protein
MALGLSQAAMGNLLGATRKTIARWEDHTHKLSADEVRTVAKALYPVDSELAEEVAQTHGTTLVSLGIAPAPPPPPTPPPAATVALPFLADAIVLVAAESFGELSPKIRPLLLAAFERAHALGLTPAEVVKGLRGDKARVDRRPA